MHPIQVVIQSTPFWERAVTLLMPLVGGALAVLGGILAERYRASRLAIQEHLKEIKQKVLSPLEENVKQILTSLIFERKSNIELVTQQIPRTEYKATEYSWDQRDVLQIAQPLEFLPKSVSDALYKCAKTTHYPSVIREYEILMHDFNEYNQACLRYVQSITDTINNDLSGLAEQPKNIRAEALALHIYNRQRNFQALPVHLRESTDSETNSIELPTSDGVVIKATQEVTKHSISLIERLEKDRRVIDSINSQANKIGDKAEKLGPHLEQLIHVASLPGKCELLNN